MIEFNEFAKQSEVEVLAMWKGSHHDCSNIELQGVLDEQYRTRGVMYSGRDLKSYNTALGYTCTSCRTIPLCTDLLIGNKLCGLLL